MADFVDILLAKSLIGGGSGSGSGGGSGSVSPDISKFQEDLDELSSKYDDHDEKLAEFEAAIAKNKNDIAAMGAEIDSHEVRIAALEEGGVVPPTPPTPTEPTTWELFRDSIPSHIYAIGDQILEKWNDLDWAWEIADYGTAETEDGVSHECVILQGHLSCPAMQYDAPEQQLAEGNYKDGMFYYVADDSTESTYRMLVAGTDYVVGAPIEGEVFVNDVKDETGFIVYSGYNSWELCSFRQWLNADGNDWFHATHVGDCEPENADVKGFLGGFSEDFRNILVPVKVETNDEVTYDKVFLASSKDVYGKSKETGLEYWEKVTKLKSGDPKAISARAIASISDPSTVALCRLRDGDLDSLHRVNYIKTTGAVSVQSGARKSNPGLVLCAICV